MRGMKKIIKYLNASSSSCVQSDDSHLSRECKWDSIRSFTLTTFVGVNFVKYFFFTHFTYNFEMKNFNYSIFSIDGKEIISGIFNEKEKINVQNLHSGVYFIQFKKNNISYKNFKFIKE